MSKFKLNQLFFIIFFCISTTTALYLSDWLPAQPLFGWGDTATWETLGHYFSQHVQFLPYPHIDFNTDTFFYPYGGSIVFLGWGVERDLFYYFYQSILGFNNALIVYHCLSLLISCFGAYFILKKQFGSIKAALAGFVVTFFNFYAIAKMPGHFNMTIVHWTTLSICLDYLIVHRLAGKEPITLPIVLSRLLLLILSVGQTLGYVAGYALLSFILMFAWSTILLIDRKIRFPENKFFQNTFSNFKEDFRSAPKTCMTIFLSTLLIGAVYIPLDLSIVLAVKEFQTPLNGSGMWASPWRVLIPWFPWINPGNLSDSLIQFFKPEMSEGFGANSPGYFLLLTGLLGIIYSKRKMAAAFCLLLFIIAVTNHPYQTLSITHLPWLEFARVGSRISIIFAPALGLLLLSIPFERISYDKKVVATALILICLGGLELWTFNSLFKFKAPKLSANFYNYMNTINKSQGEAVLDWPFCIAGGNGVGTSQLGPFYGRNNYIGFMNRFHNKKVVGIYTGRMTDTHIRPFLVAGFDKIFSPDSRDIMRAKRQNRQMTKEEWNFLDTFYTLNDFSGINLFTDLIHPKDKQLFFKRFGKPIAQVRLPKIGQACFIPKGKARRKQANPQLGKEIKFIPLLNKMASLSRRDKELTVLDFVLAETPMGYAMAAKNESRILFNLKAKQRIKLDIAGTAATNSPIKLQLKDQRLSLEKSFRGTVELQGEKGINSLQVISDAPDYVVGFNEIRITPLQNKKNPSN